ncbi:hypothetical protein [Devosia sp.]|uniref:hypothetical protein n=1 Tax=Devosia sp. TaxID=1871048 RepID=UPI002AFE6500|nr:hypothetical protein [Devosia sp.]
MRRAFLCATSLLALATPALAGNYADILTPAQPGRPLAFPIAEADIAPPPFVTPNDWRVTPAYVPGLPGLPQGRSVSDDFGRKPLKYDGVFIRQSRVENGEVVIPAGGLVYLEDSWGGEVALRGEQLPVLSRLPIYVDFDMSIAVAEDVTIPAGGSAVVGGTVYNYYATVGHETLTNHTLHVRTIAGTDWEWAFGSPVLSTSEPGWWGTGFTQLDNQGQAREISREQLTFDWLSGVRMDRLLLAEEQVFSGFAGVGQSWTVGERTLRVAALDPAAGTVTLDIVEGGAVTGSRTLGPVQPDLMIEDTAARKALVLEDGDVVAFLSPWPTAFEEGKASLKVYGKAFSLNFGDDYAGDPRFSVYPVGCPTGHGFGFMLVNKQEIRIAPGGVANGPESYFKIAVGAIEGGHVTDWHIEDAQGNRSVNLGSPNQANIDLVLGQGRVAGQAILKDTGRAMLARTYDTTATLENAVLAAGVHPASFAPAIAPAPVAVVAAPEPGFSPAMAIVIAVLVLAAGALGYELARRRPLAV